MGVLEIGSTVNLLYSHELSVEDKLFTEHVADFALDEFVDSFETMFSHEKERYRAGRKARMVPFNLTHRN